MKLALAFIAGLVACGRSEPPPSQPVAASGSAIAGTVDAGADVGSAEGRYSSVRPIRMGTMQVNGRLAPEIIQRVVRENFSHIHGCYTQALGTESLPAGFLVTKFVIDRSGNVSAAAADGDAAMIAKTEIVDCVVAILKALKFPRPEGGIVSVVYPLSLDAAD